MKTTRSVLTFPLMGAGGEPVDLWRTIASHGLASLPPMAVDEASRSLEVTVGLAGARPRTVRVRSGRPGRGEIEVAGRAPGPRLAAALRERVGYILRLDEDLSAFYERAAADPALSWATAGAGRMARSATVFEEVVKTIATTNCAWSATKRMVGALVEHLGEPAATAPESGPLGRAFPTPEAMAGADESFYKNVVRAGYRGPYFIALAESVANGSVDLEGMARAKRDELSDDEMAAELLALPGVGPYAAAHIMMMIGRYSRLILDSWTRPTYARIVRRKTVSDETMQRRWRRYGPYAGLAFWLFLTRDWVDEEPL